MALVAGRLTLKHVVDGVNTSTCCHVSRAASRREQHRTHHDVNYVVGRPSIDMISQPLLDLIACTQCMRCGLFATHVARSVVCVSVFVCVLGTRVSRAKRDQPISQSINQSINHLFSNRFKAHVHISV